MFGAVGRRQSKDAITSDPVIRKVAATTMNYGDQAQIQAVMNVTGVLSAAGHRQGKGAMVSGSVVHKVAATTINCREPGAMQTQAVVNESMSSA